jgi:hypothetical protein
VLAGLVVLLVGACQGGTTADSEFADTTGRTHPAETTADEGGETRSTTERKHQAKTTADKKRRTTDATSQTLGLLADLVETCNKMLAKLAGQQQAYASADNEQGAQLMVEASDNVKDVQDAALSLQRKIASDGDGAPPAAGPSGPSLAFKVEMEEIEKSTNALEDTLAEARRCCGLPPDFLSSDLQELRAKTNSVEQLTIQKIESEQPAASPMAQPTAQPTASPEAQPTASPEAQPTAEPTAQPTAQPTAESTAQ